MGCCCHVETISEVSSMCAARAGGAPAGKARRRRETSPPALRRSHRRPVENLILCKMLQLGQMLEDSTLHAT